MMSSLSLHRPRLAMMTLLCGCSLVAGFASPGIRAADFEKESREVSTALEPLRQKLGPMLVEGNIAEANRKLLASYPAEKRTPVQAYVLGNLLFSFDPKASYALHEEAALKLPEESAAQFEWAIEQHRKGDYAGALASYDAFSAKKPEFAPVHGLAADCLIRLGRTKEAVSRWQRSERAKNGDLEMLESIVCEIYKETKPLLERDAWVAKAKAGDVEAAVSLIALDGNFETDWWNKGPRRAFLKSDLAVLKKLPADPRIKAALCTGDCLMPEEPDAKQVGKILLQSGFIVDPAKTLPTDGPLLSLMLGVAMDAAVMLHDEAREQFGAKLLERARTSKDASLWNLVANLYLGQPELEDIEKQAWEATGDSRFAVGYLAELATKKTLKADHPMLLKALAQYPEESQVVAMAMSVTLKPDEALLIQGIRAEYRHFSATAFRPDARTLRAYFKKLAAIQS